MPRVCPTGPAELIDIVCVRAGRRSDDEGAVLQRGGCARGTLPQREHFHRTRTQLASYFYQRWCNRIDSYFYQRWCNREMLLCTNALGYQRCFW